LDANAETKPAEADAFIESHDANRQKHFTCCPSWIELRTLWYADGSALTSKELRRVYSDPPFWKSSVPLFPVCASLLAAY
jgi:hypothetical protein